MNIKQSTTERENDNWSLHINQNAISCEKKIASGLRVTLCINFEIKHGNTNPLILHINWVQKQYQICVLDMKHDLPFVNDLLRLIQQGRMHII